jgi:hypothetical protein
MMPEGKRLPCKRVDYLNNALEYDNRTSIFIYLCSPLLERPAETQVLELFDMMKAPDEGSWGYNDGGYISSWSICNSRAPMQTPWMLASRL